MEFLGNILVTELFLWPLLSCSDFTQHNPVQNKFQFQVVISYSLFWLNFPSVYDQSCLWLSDPALNKAASDVHLVIRVAMIHNSITDVSS